MTKSGRAVLVGVTWMLVACGGAPAPAESPASEAPPSEEEAAPKANLESGPVTTLGEEAPPDEPAVKQELPCPGKKAKYWDSGLLRSEVVTEDCEVNGYAYKAGSRLDFDEDGQLLPPE